MSGLRLRTRVRGAGSCLTERRAGEPGRRESPSRLCDQNREHCVRDRAVARAYKRNTYESTAKLTKGRVLLAGKLLKTSWRRREEARG